MRRADAIWLWDGSAYTDVTTALGFGTGTVSLAAGQSLYVGYHDWLDGVAAFVAADAGTGLAIVPEVFNGTTEDWERLPLQERVDQLSSGHILSPMGYDFRTDGVSFWGATPLLWTLKRATATFPEALAPPSTPELFWIRLRGDTGSATLVLKRLLPVPYNTYAEHQDVANFFGLPLFSEQRAPRISYVRERIRSAEDWFDTYTRRAWRLRYAINERQDFNPHGHRLRHRPAWFATLVALWDGSQFRPMVEGRSFEWWLDSDKAICYFTFPAFRLRPYAIQLNRYARQQNAFQISYVYGADFDTAPEQGLVREAILKKVASEMILQADWSGYTISNPDVVPKAEKAEEYRKSAEATADLLRAVVVA